MHRIEARHSLQAHRRLNIALVAMLTASTMFMVWLALPARAEIFSVCEVLPTSDGFVALRDKPTTQGKLLHRMHPGDMAVIDVKDGDYVQSGDWLLIEFHRRDGASVEEKYDFVAKGWAYTKYIDECG